jgi:predicted AAA+ superfamily ATPase
MFSLYERFEIQLQNCSTNFKRYLYEKLPWESRMLGITGPRGVGKTTMILQFIKENLDTKRALYVSADDIYFSENKLIELASDFYKNAGEYLFIDEIHKYENWSLELKNIYDALPGLKVIFTGSSVLDILKGSSDLSRRAIIYSLQGLSFREYLNLFHNFNFRAKSLDEIIQNKTTLEGIDHPLPFFKDYLKRGYYPFGMEPDLKIRLGQIILQTLESDIAQYANLSVSTSRKLKRLLSIIAESVPFKPNFTKIAELLNVSRNSMDDYFYYLEQAGMIGQLRDETGGLRGLGKVEKVYLDNTNLIFNLGAEQSNIGNIRETFFYNQMRVNHEVISAKNSDFIIKNNTFEIGGSSKNQKQLPKDEHAFLVKDDIEFGHLNVIPLWAFGLNY